MRANALIPHFEQQTWLLLGLSLLLDQIKRSNQGRKNTHQGADLAAVSVVRFCEEVRRAEEISRLRANIRAWVPTCRARHDSALKNTKRPKTSGWMASETGAPLVTLLGGVEIREPMAGRKPLLG